MEEEGAQTAARGGTNGSRCREPGGGGGKGETAERRRERTAARVGHATDAGGSGPRLLLQCRTARGPTTLAATFLSPTGSEKRKQAAGRPAARRLYDALALE
ncbi:hypothetical protein MTO96_008380 [Rhipicephalus appendiculatus]